VPTEFRSYRTIEVARRLGVSLQTVQRWVDSGQLKAWKTLGGHRRIDADSAEALFRTQMPEALAGNATPSTGVATRQVLVVDDDPLDLELMVALVGQVLPDASIDVASDGFQALLMVGNAAPGILITDVNMPHMDGFEMLRSLAQSKLKAPDTIVAVSSLSPSDLAARGRLLPGVHFLSKPVDREHLATLLGVSSPESPGSDDPS
jgi:excisionase family DNA binding protein